MSNFCNWSLDSITISKFATILLDTSRPPNMCYCGKAFVNVLEVAAHDTEAHKNGYKCGYEGGTGVICDKSYNEKGKCWKHVCIVHLKLFNKKCKYADCLWQGCDEEAERLQHYVKKHGEEHPEITCVECKATFSQINKLRKHFTKCGNKIAEFQCDQCRKTHRDKYRLNNYMKTDHHCPDI